MTTATVAAADLMSILLFRIDLMIRTQLLTSESG